MKLAKNDITIRGHPQHFDLFVRIEHTPCPLLPNPSPLLRTSFIDGPFMKQ